MFGIVVIGGIALAIVYFAIRIMVSTVSKPAAAALDRGANATIDVIGKVSIVAVGGLILFAIGSAVMK